MFYMYACILFLLIHRVKKISTTVNTITPTTEQTTAIITVVVVVDELEAPYYPVVFEINLESAIFKRTDSTNMTSVREFILI